jgi:hypothetical protein
MDLVLNVGSISCDRAAGDELRAICRILHVLGQKREIRRMRRRYGIRRPLPRARQLVLLEGISGAREDERSRGERNVGARRLKYRGHEFLRHWHWRGASHHRRVARFENRRRPTPFSGSTVG